MHLNLNLAILNVALLWLLTTPHEFAHAWVATRLGDDTPRLQGRLTLNPLAHVDWLGTTILPALTSLFGGGFIGWGKPVYTNPAKLRWGLNGLALVAMAGPASNVVFAVILALVARAAAAAAPALSQFAARGVYLSLYLAIFNMLPVPPLDGGHILRNFLPYRAAQIYDRLGMISLFLIFFFGGGIIRGITYPAIRFFFGLLGY